MNRCRYAAVVDRVNNHYVGYHCTWKEDHRGPHIFNPIDAPTGRIIDLGKVYGIRKLEAALLSKGWKVGSHDLANLARIGRIPCSLYVPNHPSESLWSKEDITATVAWFEENWRGAKSPPLDETLLDRQGVLVACGFSRSALEYWNQKGQLKPAAYLHLGRGRPTPVWTLSTVNAFIESIQTKDGAS